MARSSDVAWMAWAAHLYTASGAVVAFLATLAVGVGDFRRAFAWLLIAVLIDASDGWLARRARVAVRTPQVDGTRLDDLGDYLTFVFVPMLIVWRADLLPGSWGLAVVGAVLIASALAFVQADAKTADHLFTLLGHERRLRDELKRRRTRRLRDDRSIVERPIGSAPVVSNSVPTPAGPSGASIDSSRVLAFCRSPPHLAWLRRSASSSHTTSAGAAQSRPTVNRRSPPVSAFALPFPVP